MDLNAKAGTFKDGLRELEAMVQQTELAVIGDAETASLITNNVNFYTKSFLISACAHLEMCIKEIVFEIAKDIDARLSSAVIPSSVIEWRLNQRRKADSSSPSRKLLSVNMTKKEVDDLVSGNVYRTKEALALVGIELAADIAQWELWKDSIQAIVTRRNNIVHHNDDASDLSLGDIRTNITSIIEYIDFVIQVCYSQHGIGPATSNAPVA
jgi:hypothetical protein